MPESKASRSCEMPLATLIRRTFRATRLRAFMPQGAHFAGY
jgi:hypothetical protein